MSSVSVSFLFPGQGSQYPHMLKKLPPHPQVEATLKDAENILQSKITELDSEQSFKSTVSVQTCLFIAGVAAARALQAEGINPALVAGLSVGSFAAAVTAGSLDFADGLLLVRARAVSMEESFPSGFGMTAIVGLTEKQVSRIIEQVHTTDEPVYMSNINGPVQMVASGSNGALSKLETACASAGAKKVERLAVSVPSHCPLLQATTQILQDNLAGITIKDPVIPYVGNMRARVLKDSAKVSEELAKNVTNCVRWYDSITLMAELGTTIFIEMNPGTILSRICDELLPHLKSFPLENGSLPDLRYRIQHLER